MKSLSFSIFLLLLACASVRAELEEYEEEVHSLPRGQPLPELKGAAIENTIKSHDKVLLFYYTPDCYTDERKLCITIEQMLSMISGMFPNVFFGKVDGEALGGREAAANAPYNVQHMPSVKFYIEAYPRDIPGGFSGDLIAAFLKAYSVPAVVPIETKAAKTQLTGKLKSAAAVLYLPEEKGHLYDVYTRTAKRFLISVPFFFVSNPKIAASFGMEESPALAIVRPAQRAVQYKLPANPKKLHAVTVEDLTAWVEMNRKCLVNEINAGNVMDLYAVPMHILALVDEKRQEASDKVIVLLRSIAKKYTENTNLGFFFSDASFPTLYTMFKADPADAPLLVAFPAEMQPVYHYPADDAHPMDAEHVEQWVADVLAGTAPKRTKSAPPPAKNDGPVKTATLDTFEGLVLKHPGVAAVKFYSPTCPHCVALKPTYEELAVSYASDDDVLLAEFDAGANDLPPGTQDLVKGYPTILLWPAGPKARAAPVAFNGARTLEKLREFVESGRQPVVVDETEVPAKGDL